MAGRVLSKANEKKLRDATEAINTILELLDKEDVDADEESDEAKESARILSEAANLGNWLESRIHMAFTEIADMLFGEGRLNRQERIALSSAIGDALTAFNNVVTESVPELYQREPWGDAPSDDEEPALAESALESAFVPLLEQAVRGDGTIPMKIIAPGWGASGYYPKEVLQRDGPNVFVKGTKSFWNHPTAQEEVMRPEGDLNLLAAELVSDARYADGPAGEGLYADAKVFGPYQEAVDELAPHIGVSIRASGRATQGEAEGRKGPIIQALTSARSVDFVTEPGAGGKIIQMFEAARRVTAPQSKGDEVNEAQFNEAVGKLEAENLRLREAMTLRDAKEQIREALAKTTLPAITQGRLLVRLAQNPPLKDGALDATQLTERINAAVSEETHYLAAVAGYSSGRIEGMGQSESGGGQAQTQEQMTQRMAESFMALGLSESSAAQAAKTGW